MSKTFELHLPFDLFPTLTLMTLTDWWQQTCGHLKDLSWPSYGSGFVHTRFSVQSVLNVCTYVSLLLWVLIEQKVWVYLLLRTLILCHFVLCCHFFPAFSTFAAIPVPSAVCSIVCLYPPRSLDCLFVWMLIPFFSFLFFCQNYCPLNSPSGSGCCCFFPSIIFHSPGSGT